VTELENRGHTCYFAVGALLYTSVMALATLWAPLVQKWSFEDRGRRWQKNGSRV